MVIDIQRLLIFYLGELISAQMYPSGSATKASVPQLYFRGSCAIRYPALRACSIVAATSATAKCGYIPQPGRVLVGRFSSQSQWVPERKTPTFPDSSITKSLLCDFTCKPNKSW